MASSAVRWTLVFQLTLSFLTLPKLMFISQSRRLRYVQNRQCNHRLYLVLLLLRVWLEPCQVCKHEPLGSMAHTLSQRSFLLYFASSPWESAAAWRKGDANRLLSFVLASLAWMCELSSFQIRYQNLGVCSCSLCFRDGISAYKTATFRHVILEIFTTA